jgi:fibrillarin-like pre-rRNA processing protein
MVTRVDSIYSDVAQPEQARVLAEQRGHVLGFSGWVVLAIKAQSIDVTKDPSEVFKNETAAWRVGVSFQEVVV